MRTEFAEWQTEIDRRADAFASRNRTKRISEANRCAFYADLRDELTPRQRMCWGIAAIGILLFVGLACLALVSKFTP